MRHSRRRTRVAALGATAAVVLSGLGLFAPASATASTLSAPTGLSPNTSSQVRKNVELGWSAVAGASSYEVQLLDDDDPDVAVVQSGTTPINRWTVPVQLPTGDYRWRVRALQARTPGPWSPLATLERGWDGQVTGLRALSEQVPTLTWSPIPDASFYEVEINPRSFVSPNYSRKDSFVCWTAQTTFTPYGVTLGGGTFDKAPGTMQSCSLAAGDASVSDITTDLIFGRRYYWRVRGRDGTVDAKATPFPKPSAACLAPWLDSGITVTSSDALGPVVTVPVGETAPRSTGAPECSDWSTESTFVPTRLASPTVSTVTAAPGVERGDAVAARSASLAAARDAASETRSTLGLDSDEALHVKDVVRDLDGSTHVRYDRTFSGLRVIGGDLVVHRAPSGAVTRIDEAHQGDVDVPTRPTVSRVTALTTGRAGTTADAGATDAELVVYAADKQPRLAYDVVGETVASDQTPSRLHTVVDAVTGARLARWDDIQRGSGHSIYSGPVTLGTLRTSDGYAMTDTERGSGSTTDLGGSTWGSGALLTDPDDTWGDGTADDRASAAVDAHYGAAVTWDYFRNVHGRNGVFDDGRGVLSRVHYGNGYENAFWDGTRMTYGDGADNAHPLTSIDIAAHEMSHGVTQATADLDYVGEAGGLNEATSDIFGTAVEFSAGNADDPGDYLIGEQVDLNGDGTPLRYLDRPSKDGYAVDCWSSDVGRLDPHDSSGVGNHFFYLASEGSGEKTVNGVTYDSPTCDDSSVSGVGRSTVQRVWYRALTTYMTSTTTYAQAREATMRAAVDLYGAGSAQCLGIAAAWDAVSVPRDAVGCGAIPTGLAVSPLAAGTTTRVTGDPTFDWSPVPNALYYRLYVSRDPKIGDLDFVASTQATQITPVTGLGLTSTAQYWAVQACGVTTDVVTTEEPDTHSDCGPLSAVRPVSQVTTNPATPASFTTGRGYLVATWRAAVSPRTPAKAYDVKVTNTETGEVVELDAVKDGFTRTDRVADAVDSGTARFSVPSSALEDGTYRFQVRAVSEAGRVTSWSGLSPSAVVDTASPGLALQSGSGFVGTTAVSLRSTEPLLSVSGSNLGVRGPSGVVAGTLARVSTTSFTFRPKAPWVTGGHYTAWTTARDRAGKTVTVTSAPRRAGTTADSSGMALTFVSGDRSWSSKTSSAAYGKSYRSTRDDARTSRRAYVAATVYGTSLGVGTCKSPTSGSLQVWVDGKLRTTAKLYRSYTGCGTTVSVKGLSAAQHSVKLVAVANGSRGDVAVDRVTVT